MKSKRSKERKRPILLGIPIYSNGHGDVFSKLFRR